MKRIFQVCVGVACISFALAAPANAGTVSIQGNTLVFQAAPGEANALTVTNTFQSGQVVLVRDVGRAMKSASLECVAILQRAVCVPVHHLIDKTLVLTGDRNDTVAVTGLRAEVHAGAGDDLANGSALQDVLDGDEGNDRLYGGGNGDGLSGGPGDDRLYGGAWDDELHGDAGDDLLDGGADGDHMFGGSGADVIRGGSNPTLSDGYPHWGDMASYFDRTASVHVTPDGVANDGEASEGDNVLSDVEAIVGGHGDDTLESLAPDGSAHALSGGDGSDTLIARNGQRESVDCGGDLDTALIDTGLDDPLDCETFLP
jgi:Ca2+-binding RTX toxin-like protein